MLFLLTSTWLISHFNFDIKMQTMFYDANSSEVWYQKDYPAWDFAYHYGPYLAIILTVGALIIFVLSWSVQRFKKLRMHCALILLTMILGPGLVINGLLKDRWGRPRPRQIEQFGGDRQFHEIWQPGIPGKGKSFPCGHCAMGFIFIVLFYSFRKKNKSIAYSCLIFSLIYGSYIGMARIAQGGHFLSDVIWSGGITYLIATLLYFDILKIPEAKRARSAKKKLLVSVSKPVKTFLTLFLLVISLSLLIFIFLFAKPFYKQYRHPINVEKSFNHIILELTLEKTNVILQAGDFSNPLKLETTLQGYGFPEHKFSSNLQKTFKQDTLFLNYHLLTEGYFYEINKTVSIDVDTSFTTAFTGLIEEGNLLVRKGISETQVKLDQLKIKNGKIIQQKYIQGENKDD